LITFGAKLKLRWWLHS